MKKFDDKVKAARNKTKRISIIFIIMAIIFVLIGLFMGNTNKESWENFNTSISKSDYYKAKVYFLEGPFAEYTTNGITTEEIYIAYAENDEIFIVNVSTSNKNIPIYGVDVTEEDIPENIEEMESVAVYGYSTKIDNEVAQLLVDYMNEGYDEELFNLFNYKDVFGEYYLDTTNISNDGSIVCYVLAAFFCIIGIIYLFTNKNKKLIENSITVLEQRAILEDVKEDYENSESKKYKKIKLELTDKYIYSFADSIIVVPYEDVTKVYHSNVVNGKYQLKMYIALETIDSIRYFVAGKPLSSKNAEFDEALEYIRNKIKAGGF